MSPTSYQTAPPRIGIRIEYVSPQAKPCQGSSNPAAPRSFASVSISFELVSEKAGSILNRFVLCCIYKLVNRFARKDEAKVFPGDSLYGTEIVFQRVDPAPQPFVFHLEKFYFLPDHVQPFTVHYNRQKSIAAEQSRSEQQGAQPHRSHSEKPSGPASLFSQTRPCQRVNPTQQR